MSAHPLPLHLGGGGAYFLSQMSCTAQMLEKSIVNVYGLRKVIVKAQQYSCAKIKIQKIKLRDQHEYNLQISKERLA